MVTMSVPKPLETVDVIFDCLTSPLFFYSLLGIIIAYNILLLQPHLQEIVMITESQAACPSRLTITKKNSA